MHAVLKPQHFELRAYQEEARAAVHSEWANGKTRTLIVLPTGSGKTIVFAKIAEDLVRVGKRVLILAHRGELLDQAADKIAAATGMGCAVEKAEQSSLNEFYRVVVGSVQSLMRPSRLANFHADHFDAVIVDEAHHVLAESYQRILAHFAAANVLGVTATPDRGDMRAMGEFFDSLAYEYKLPQAIHDGYLCPIKALTIPLQIDLSQVSVQAGDFSAANVGSVLDPYLEQIADEMAEHCMDRKTLLFLPLIATSKRMQAILADRGFRSLEVNGESRDRAEVLAELEAAGPGTTCCNSMLLLEGFDCPSIDCVVCLRPTKIRSLYCQAIGRGTRLHPGKDHLLLLDFLWLSERHELCRPAHIIAENKEVADKMTENIAAAGCPVALEQAETQAEGDCIKDREQALAEKLRAMRNRKRKLVDPLQYEMSIQAEDLASYEPSFGWETKPPSNLQKDALENGGILPDGVENAGKAALLLDKMNTRRSAGLTTPKQIRFLERKGFEHVGTWQFETARKLIDRIAANGWRVPYGVNPKTYNPRGTKEDSML